MRIALFFLSLALTSFMTSPATSDPVSTLSLPLSIRLATVAQAVERALPNPIVQEQDVRTCVEAQRACTNIPEFRGLRIYSRQECVTISPRIDCSIDQLVERSGSVEVTGGGGTITLSQAFRGQATVRGRGEIGRHIRETATGSAEVTLHVTPRIGPDWRLLADLDHNIRWIQRPQANLFNFIPVTFGTRAERALNQSVNNFRSTGLQPALDRVDLRAAVATVWANLQDPIAIPIRDDFRAELRFTPSSVALAPLEVDANAITTRLSLNGTFRLSEGMEGPAEAVPLPSLSASPTPAGVSLVVPVSLGLDTLSAIAQMQLPASLDLGDSLGLSLEISQVEIEEASEGRIRFRFEARSSSDTFALNDLPLPLSLTGRLFWSSELQELRLDEPNLQVDGPGLAATAINALATSDLAVRRLSDLVRVPLTETIISLESRLIPALDSALGASIQARGVAAISLSDLRVDNELHAVFGLRGTLALDVLELQ